MAMAMEMEMEMEMTSDPSCAAARTVCGGRRAVQRPVPAIAQYRLSAEFDTPHLIGIPIGVGFTGTGILALVLQGLAYWRWFCRDWHIGVGLAGVWHIGAGFAGTGILALVWQGSGILALVLQGPAY